MRDFRKIERVKVTDEDYDLSAVGDQPRYASEYLMYQELVWKVLRVALDKGFFNALCDVQTCDIVTRREILELAGVTPSQYKEDCMEAYIREVEIRRSLHIWED